jgi:hypothetical protein
MSPKPSSGSTTPSLAKKLIAFWSLTTIQVAIAVVYREAQLPDGSYGFSPSSSLALSETFKLFLSIFLLTVQTWREVVVTRNKPAVVVVVATESNSSSNNNVEHVDNTIMDDEETSSLKHSSGDVKLATSNNKTSILHETITSVHQQLNTQIDGELLQASFGLACLYSLNNQLAFELYVVADGATVALFKSTSVIMSAILLWIGLGRRIYSLQWASIFSQVFALTIVQWDACKSHPVLTAIAYVLLLSSAFITAAASVWNEKTVKHHKADLHVQNMVLYVFGAVLNLLCFIIIPRKNKGSFFHGYNRWIALAVIGCNSAIGLAITAVYKYADVLVKTFSQACASCILMILNAYWYSIPLTLPKVLGGIIVFISAYTFFESGILQPKVESMDGLTISLNKQKSRAKRWKDEFRRVTSRENNNDSVQTIENSELSDDSD